MIGKRQKLTMKMESLIVSVQPSRIVNQAPAAMPRIVRPKTTRASSRSRGEPTGAARSSTELAMARMVPRPSGRNQGRPACEFARPLP
jgi:hypothetical protein